jgi:hypothetical protein
MFRSNNGSCFVLGGRHTPVIIVEDDDSSATETPNAAYGPMVRYESRARGDDGGGRDGPNENKRRPTLCLHQQSM